MRKNLDYGLLHAMNAFVKVVDTGTFTSAAEQMGLTTAQVSRLVSELEKRLQTQLLQRTTRRIALTGAGDAYVTECRDILERVDVAEAVASGSTIEPSGRLRVLCMGGFGHRYVVGLLAGFCSRYPKVTLEYSTSQYTPDLLAEGIDVSVYLTRQLSDSGLIALRLGRTFSVLCAAPAYFESQGMPNHPRELTSHACIRLINPSASTDWALRSGSEAYRVQPKGPLIGDNPDVLLNATEQGSGVALLPIFTVIDSIRSGRLVRALPLWRSEEIGVFALYPSRRFLDAKTKAWLDLLKTHVAPMLEADAMQFQ